MKDEEKFNLKFILVCLAIFLVLGTTLSLFFLYYQQQSRETLYVSVIPAGKAIQNVELGYPEKGQRVQEQPVDAKNLLPDIPPKNLVDVIGILAVSTGKVSKLKLTDATTREYFADATIVDFVTKANNGSLKKIETIVQIIPRDNPNKSVSLGIVQNASTISGVSLNRNTDVFSDSEIKNVFKEDSKWSLFPLVNLENLVNFYPTEVEYTNYVQRYYGGSFEEVKNLINSGLADIPSKPILLLGIDEFKIYNQ